MDNRSNDDSIRIRSPVTGGSGATVAGRDISIQTHTIQSVPTCPSCKNPLDKTNKLVKCKICKKFNFCEVCMKYFERQKTYLGKQLHSNRICELCWPNEKQRQKNTIDRYSFIICVNCIVFVCSSKVQFLRS